MKDCPVQIIMVGCGAVAQFQYAHALRPLEQTGILNVAGLVDPEDPPRAEMQRSFPKAIPYTDFSVCPLDSNTLVIVASPPRLHANQSIFALRQGAAVLCEKPMAASRKEAELMLKVAHETKSVLAVGLYKRFFPAAETLKNIFEKKPLGELQTFTIQEGEKFGWEAASDSYFRRDLTIGGVFYDLGVHAIDLLLWWLGEPEKFNYQDDAMGGIEANCQLDLLYPGGERGKVRLSRDWKTENSYTFVFERGTIGYEVNRANRLKIALNGVPSTLSGQLTRPLPASVRGTATTEARNSSESFIEQIRNVISAMRGNEPLRIPGEEGIRSLRFIENCYAERTLMDMPWLSFEEVEAARVLAGTKV